MKSKKIISFMLATVILAVAIIAIPSVGASATLQVRRTAAGVYTVDGAPTTLRGIERRTTIRRLTISDASRLPSAQLRRLRHLPRLRNLNINNARHMRDLQDLRSLRNLQQLRLSINESSVRGIVNLRGVEGLTSLHRLEIPGTRVGTGNRLTNINRVRNLRHLRVLNVSNHRLTNLRGIENLCNLQQLNANANRLTTLYSVRNLRNLQTLMVAGNRLANLRGIENLRRLQRLYISDNRLDNLTGIENLTNIRALRIAGNRLTNVNRLRRLTRLRQLDASNNRLTNISGVQNLTRLERLNMSSNRLTRLPDLTRLRNLTYTLHEDAGRGFQSTFAFNQLSRRQLETRIPRALRAVGVAGDGVDARWLDVQAALQNVDRRIRLANQNTTTATTSISGTVHPGATVTIRSFMAYPFIDETVMADHNGRFRFDNLDLTGRRGHTLFLSVTIFEANHTRIADKEVVVGR